MTDIKQKVTKMAEEAAKKAQEVSKKTQEAIKDADLETKAKNAAKAANDKYESSGLKSKVAEQLSEENKAALAAKSKTACAATKAFVAANKVILKKVAIGAAAAVLVVGAFSAIFDSEYSINYKEGGQDKTLTYYFDNSKIYGNLLITGSGEQFELTEGRKTLSGGMAVDVLDVIEKSSFTHPKSKTEIDDVVFTLVMQGNFGNTKEYHVYQEQEFEYKGQMVKGLGVYVVGQDQTYKAKSPYIKVIYTQYY